MSKFSKLPRYSTNETPQSVNNKLNIMSQQIEDYNKQLSYDNFQNTIITKQTKLYTPMTINLGSFNTANITAQLLSMVPQLSGVVLNHPTLDVTINGKTMIITPKVVSFSWSGITSPPARNNISINLQIQIIGAGNGT